MQRVINLTTNLHSRGELLLSFPTLIINSNLGGAGKKTERGGGGGGGGGLRWPIMPPPPSPSSFNATATRTWNPLTERAQARRAPSEVVRTKKRGHFPGPKSVRNLFKHVSHPSFLNHGKITSIFKKLVASSCLNRDIKWLRESCSHETHATFCSNSRERR